MRQVYRGSDHQVPVGSFPTEGALDSDHTGSVLGFRLVHDASNRVGRGGSWSSTADGARAADRLGDFPGNRFDGLGFRLAADWDTP